jgi:RNA polymerase primary sigma factor
MASNIKAPPKRNTRAAPKKQALETYDISLPLPAPPGKELLPSACINVVETQEVERGEEAEPGEEAATQEEPDEEAEAENELVKVQQGQIPIKSDTKAPAERSDDRRRMYLHANGLGGAPLARGRLPSPNVSRPAARPAMAGLCESPLTFQAIIIWRDELNEGKVSLRDIIDLEATHAGPDAKAVLAPVIGPNGQHIVSIAASGQTEPPPQMRGPASAPTTTAPLKPAGEYVDGEKTTADGTLGESDLDDDMENWLSLAAIEAELKPKVIETFDNVASAYKRLRRLQDQDIQSQLKSLSLSPAQERKYKKLQNEIIGEVKSLRLRQARIDSLVEQLYDINKRLVGHEGRMLRLAESHGISRDDFLCAYRGSELDPLWLDHVSNLSAKGWKRLVARDKDAINSHRREIHALASQTGLEIGEFRKIVQMVQKGEREARKAKKEMVEANLRLVISLRKIYQPPALT